MERITLYDGMNPKTEPVGDRTKIVPGDVVVYRDEDWAYRTRTVAKVQPGKDLVVVLEPVVMKMGEFEHVLEHSCRLPVSKVLRLMRSKAEQERLDNLPPPKPVSEIAAPGAGPVPPERAKAPRIVRKTGIVAVGDMDKSWRKLAAAGKFKAAMNTILFFMEENPDHPTMPLLWFKVAQLHACSDDLVQAVQVFPEAFVQKRGSSDWNAWVQANLCFLQGSQEGMQAEIRKAGQFGWAVKGLLQAARQGMTDYRAAYEKAVGCSIYGPRCPSPTFRIEQGRVAVAA